MKHVIGCLLTCLVTLVVASSLRAADPVVIRLDWEPACGGSAITVTSVDGVVVTIEAFAEHSRDSREWLCTFSSGKLLSVIYRHYRVEREASSPDKDGGFETRLVLDECKVFRPAANGELPGAEEKLNQDFAEMLALALGGKKTHYLSR